MDKPVFTCELPWDESRRADTLVIYCSAYDFRSYFREFLSNHLNLEDYDLIAVPGGAQVFTLAHYLPKYAALMRKWIEFLTKHHHLARIVILGHEDCGWYKDFRFGPIHIDLRERQLKDLRETKVALHEILGIPVDVFFAKFSSDKLHIEFIAVE